MRKRVSEIIWIPLWVDKWLWGSTRIELEPDERSVWVDLMALAAKDDGFIRANEITPYPVQQLAGMFCIKLELLERAIEKCIRFEKLVKLENGALYIKNWDEYKLTERYKRMLKAEATSEKTEMSSAEPEADTGKADTKSNQIRSDQIKSEKNIGRPEGADLHADRSSKPPGPDKALPSPGYPARDTTRGQPASPAASPPKASIEQEFEAGFWKAYPIKVRKKDALAAYKALRKKVPEETLAQAFNGYMEFLKHKRIRENFEQSPMHPTTFLRSERWKDYAGFKYKPAL